MEAVTGRLKAQAVRVKAGTIVDASVVASAGEGDGEAGWSGHRARKAIHGYKVHVGVDADTAIAERVAVTPGNRHDGRCGELALPDAPGGVYAGAVRARGGRPRVAITSIWCRADEDPREKLAAINSPIQRVRGRIREGVRHLQAQPWPETHAMAWPRQRRTATHPHRHRLQPQTHPQHPRRRITTEDSVPGRSGPRRGTSCAKPNSLPKPDR